MANLYGVANAPTTIQYFGASYFLSGGQVLTHDVNTVIGTTGPLIAPSSGYFYALSFLTFEIQNGAAVPQGLNIGSAIGAGSYTNTIGYYTYWLTPSGNNFVSATLYTSASQVAWQGAGSVVNFGVNPATNSTTILAGGAATVMLVRAPDQ